MAYTKSKDGVSFQSHVGYDLATNDDDSLSKEYIKAWNVWQGNIN